MFLYKSIFFLIIIFLGVLGLGISQDILNNTFKYRLFEIKGKKARLIIKKKKKLAASGRKFPVSSGTKRLPTSIGNARSQTLPRNMGRSQPSLPIHRSSLAKAALTPPAVKRQLSVPGNESPLRRRPTTPSGTAPVTGASSGNRAAILAKRIPQLKGVDPKLAQVIVDEIVEGGAPVLWHDIAGQEVIPLFYIRTRARLIYRVRFFFSLNLSF